MRRAIRRRELPLHLMLLPAVVLVLIYSYGPMAGIYIAFHDFNPAKLFSSPWVGLENFRYVLAIPGSLTRRLEHAVYRGVQNHWHDRGARHVRAAAQRGPEDRASSSVFQTIIYIPNFLSWVIMAGVLIDILSPTDGIVNQFLGIFGIKPVFFLGSDVLVPDRDDCLGHLEGLRVRHGGVPRRAHEH